MNNAEQYLKTAQDLGFADAYLELMGGGNLAVWIPLQSTAYDYALLNEIGIGLYPHGWDGDQIEMILDDGTVWAVPTDPANSDYQRYLRWLENPEAEQSTPMVADE